MPTILFAALLLIGAMVLYPDTPAGRVLRRWLVEAPANALSSLRPRRLVGPAVLVVIGAVLFLLFEAEGLRLFAMLLPEAVGWLALFDAALALDAAALLLLAGGSRVKPVLARLNALARKVLTLPPAVARRAARAIRTAAARRPKTPRRDDPEPTVWNWTATRSPIAV